MLSFQRSNDCSCEVRHGPPHLPANGPVLRPLSTMLNPQSPLPPSKDLSQPDPTLAPLYRHRSWSPEAGREEAWLRRQGNHKKRSKSVTDEDFDELKACMELGFGFESPELDHRLSETFPALSLYHAVNKQYTDSLPKATTSLSSSDCDSPCPLGSPNATIFSPGENPQTVKTRLRQWARVVACSVRQWS